MGGTAALTGASGEIIYRRVEAADAPLIVKLLGDEQVYPNTLQLPMPGVDPLRQRMEASVKEPQNFGLLALAGGEPIGHAGLHPVTASLRTRHVAGLYIAVAPAWWGRGVSRELMRRVLDWADNWAGLLRVELGVYTDNERAIALYRRFGFVTEGVQRANSLRNGEYADTMLMARLHPKPPRLPAAAPTA